jgi:hypothetical protein
LIKTWEGFTDATRTHYRLCKRQKQRHIQCISLTEFCRCWRLEVVQKVGSVAGQPSDAVQGTVQYVLMALKPCATNLRVIVEALRRIEGELVDPAIGSTAGRVFRVEIGELDACLHAQHNQLFIANECTSSLSRPGGLIELAVSRDAERASMSCSSPCAYHISVDQLYTESEDAHRASRDQKRR